MPEQKRNRAGKPRQTIMGQHAPNAAQETTWVNIDKVLMQLLTLCKTIDFTTPEGRVFQISGNEQMHGCYERFGVGTRNATRSNLGKEAAARHLQNTERIILYTHHYDDGVVIEGVTSGNAPRSAAAIFLEQLESAVQEFLYPTEK